MNIDDSGIITRSKRKLLASGEKKGSRGIGKKICIRKIDDDFVVSDSEGESEGESVGESVGESTDESIDSARESTKQPTAEDYEFINDSMLLPKPMPMLSFGFNLTPMFRNSNIFQQLGNNMRDEDNYGDEDEDDGGDEDEDDDDSDDSNATTKIRWGSRKKCKDCKKCRKCEKETATGADINSAGKKCKRCRICSICQIPYGRKIYDDYMCDKYFKGLVESDKCKYIKLLSDIAIYNKQDVPIKYKILDKPLSIKNLSLIMDKIKTIEDISPHSGEYHKLKRWIDTISRVPFGEYRKIITIDEGGDKINEYLRDVEDTLNHEVYGQFEAKDKLLQVIGKWISNPESVGNVIALQGPPGIGKTSLIKDGLARALKFPFGFITLGGVRDAAVLKGHGYTWEGSTHGRIVDILVEAGCMNPIIFFDELDKMSGTEISNVLTHLVDGTQNMSFQDEYFAGIEFDLSKALFIFSYNDESMINYILSDRISKIALKGFEITDKIVIAKQYLIPKIVSDVFGAGFGIRFAITDTVIEEVIRKYTMESGVRRLKECFENIFYKLNLIRLYPENNAIYCSERLKNLWLGKNGDDREIALDMDDIVLDSEMVIDLLESAHYHGLDVVSKVNYIENRGDMSRYNQKQVMPLNNEKIIGMRATIATKFILMKKMEEFRMVKPNDSDYPKIHKWITNVDRIPFGKYSRLPVGVESSPEQIATFLGDIRQGLDGVIYGQMAAKNKLLQTVAQWISNPDGVGNVIGLCGPPGIGKTSLMRDGLARVLGRPFCFYSLGGVSDVSVMKGHSYTYIGAGWGKIVDMLMDAKCMNPILYFDELDKVGVGHSGVNSVMDLVAQLVDKSQNTSYQDDYFAGVELDISRTLFVFSYNYGDVIPAVLRDRITVIEMNGYDIRDKIAISRDYLMKQVAEEIGIPVGDLTISDDVIKFIINNFSDMDVPGGGGGKTGVRKLRECFATIYSKINLAKYLGHSEIGVINLPMEITTDMARILLKTDGRDRTSEGFMYM